MQCDRRDVHMEHTVWVNYHGDDAYDEAHLCPGRDTVLRVPVALTERVGGCWACEHPRGVPIPLDEFPSGGDIGLCTRHWNWWVGHFANLSPDREPPEPPCAAHLLESEIARERAALRPEAGDPVMTVAYGRCDAPQTVPWDTSREHLCDLDPGHAGDHVCGWCIACDCEGAPATWATESGDPS